MIRAATLFDLRAVYLLERQIFPKDAYPYPDLAILFLTPGVVNLKAVNDQEKLIGYACGTRGWLPFQPSWVITLGVATAYQNQGVGRKLLRACEERLAPNRVLLTVRISNTPAIHLYESAGYEIIETKRFYYRDGEDGLIMEHRRTN